MKRTQAEELVKLYKKKDEIENVINGFGLKPKDPGYQTIYLAEDRGDGHYKITQCLGLSGQTFQDHINLAVLQLLKGHLEKIEDEIKSVEAE